MFVTLNFLSFHDSKRNCNDLMSRAKKFAYIWSLLEEGIDVQILGHQYTK